MRMRCVLLGLLLATLPCAASAADPIQVMVVGDFHMSNPDRDLHDMHADDMLSAKRQAEIAAVTTAIARFRPTQVDVEWPAELVAERYAAFVHKTLAPSRNEVVQLGFRLARQTGASIHGVDTDGDFPYPAVEAFAKAHGQEQILAEANAMIAHQVSAQQALLDTGTVSNVLRRLNDAATVRNENAFYRTMLRIGSGGEQPGADLLTAWYKRNFDICANIVQLATPGDRIVVFFGSGHAFLLRQCVREMPGYVLVEPNDYLPE